MKGAIILLLLVVLAVSVAAHLGEDNLTEEEHMMEANKMMMNFGSYGMMSGTMWFYSVFYIAVVAFIVSVIFWLTYKWIVKKR